MNKTKRASVGTSDLLRVLDMLKEEGLLLKSNHRVRIQDIFNFIRGCEEPVSARATWQIYRVKALDSRERLDFNEFYKLNASNNTTINSVLLDGDNSINWDIMPSGSYYFRRTWLYIGRRNNISSPARMTIYFDNSKFNFNKDRVSMIDLVRKYLNS